MGLYQNTYIGVFIEVKKKVENVIITKVTYETEANEIFDFPVKFSAETGLKTTKIEREQKVPKVYERGADYVKSINGNIDHWYEDYFEPSSYNKDSFKILLNGDCKYNRSIKENDEFEIDFNPNDLISDFEKEYNETISGLKDFFGESNVKVKYGVVNFMH